MNSTLFLLTALISCCVQGADWPQWRGPSRDGIVPPGPKLLDAFPKEGLRQVWKFDGIRGGSIEGGMGSVAVAEGKVVVFVHTRGNGKPAKLLTKEHLQNWGYVEGMPEDLVAQVEQTRLSIDRRRLPGLLMESKITMLLQSIPAEQAAKYGSEIRKRITYCVQYRPKEGGDAWMGLNTWKETVGLAKMVDKEYPSALACWKDIAANAGINSHQTNWIYGQLLAEAFPAFDTVVCLDASTGKQLWRKDFPGDIKPQWNGMHWAASSTPAIAQGRCYVQGSAGFYCLSLQDGATVWQQPTNFSHASPLVLKDKIIAMTPWLTAFEAESGRILWLQNKGPSQPDFIATSPTTWTRDGKTYLITLGQGNAPYCSNPDTGNLLWDTPKDRNEGHASPVVSGDLLLACNTVYTLTPKGAEKLWQLKGGQDRASSLTLWQDRVYAHMRGPLSFDVKSGDVKWQGPSNYNGEIYSPVMADGKLIGCWGAEGNQELVMYKAGGERFEELGRVKLNMAFGSSPAIADGKLYLRLEDGVACYDLEKQ